jgi:hypothetical protein
MRATCARVLAAALMTAAIATVVGMSALFRPASEAARPIAAPPSSLQRTVRVTAHVLPARRQSRPSPARLVTRSTIAVRPRPAPVTRLATVRRQRTRPPAPARQLAETITTTVVTTTTTTTAAPPAVEPAAAPAPAPEAQPGDAADGPGRHGRGHAYGHDKQDD